MTRLSLAFLMAVVLAGAGCKDKGSTSTSGTPTVNPAKSVTPDPKSNASENPALAAVKKKLIGTWVVAENDIETQLTFGADGAYSVKQRNTGMGEFTTPDTDKHAWGLNDEATIQVYNVAKIGGRDEKIPRTTHKIESLSETELKLEKWKGTFKRTS